MYDDKSIAKIGNGVALFTLQKQKEELWDQLSNNGNPAHGIIFSFNYKAQETFPEYVKYVFITEDKCKQKEIREKAILKAQEKATADSQAKAAKQQEESKFALKTMMKVRTGFWLMF